jgi:protein TonB
MLTEGGRAVVTARVAGRPRRLATEKQWRAAIACGDLKPDDRVEYQAPDCSPDTRTAGDVPELRALFSELLPDFTEWGRPADLVPEAAQTTSDEPPPHQAVTLQEPTAAAAPSAPRAGASQPANKPAKRPPAPAASPGLGGTAERDKRNALLPVLIGGGVIAVILLGVLVLSGPDSETEPVEEIAAGAAAPEPYAPAPAEAAGLPEPDMATPSPTPNARELALRERQRLQREARSTSTPTPTPTPTPTFVPPPPVAVVSQARAVQPRDLSRWANRIGEDYPTRARERGEEGTVGFRVTVGSNGRVEACDVTSSSGSVNLDKAACQGLRRYARFNPALNDAGEPIAGTWSSALTYRLN